MFVPLFACAGSWECHSTWTHCCFDSITEREPMKSFPQSLFFFFCKFGYLKLASICLQLADQLVCYLVGGFYGTQHGARHEDAANACNGHLRTTNASIDIRARQTHLHINGKKKKGVVHQKSNTTTRWKPYVANLHTEQSSEA